MRRSTSTTAAALTVAVLLGAAGCSGGEVPADSSSAADGSAAGAQPARPEAVPAPGRATSGGAGASTGAATGGSAGAAPAPKAAPGRGRGGRAAAITDAVLLDRDVIYTADLTVAVAEVRAAAERVESLTDGLGGIVAGSELTTELVPAEPEDGADTEASEGTEQRRRVAEAKLTLRVPPRDFDALLGDVGELGTVLTRNLNARDVTSEVVDVASRISSQRRALTRIRELVEQADGLNDVVTLESELSRREADLESLRARRDRLQDRTALSTVEVDLVAADTAAAAALDEDEDTGFTAGLRSGWEALTATAAVAATAVGAVLPFAVAAIVLGPPVAWIVARARRSTRKVAGANGP